MVVVVGDVAVGDGASAENVPASCYSTVLSRVMPPQNGILSMCVYLYIIVATLLSCCIMCASEGKNFELV